MIYLSLPSQCSKAMLLPNTWAWAFSHDILRVLLHDLHHLPTGQQAQWNASCCTKLRVCLSCTAKTRNTAHAEHKGQSVVRNRETFPIPPLEPPATATYGLFLCSVHNLMWRKPNVPGTDGQREKDKGRTGCTFLLELLSSWWRQEWLVQESLKVQSAISVQSKGYLSSSRMKYLL